MYLRLSFLLQLILVLIYFASRSPEELQHVVYNADYLLIPSVYKDLFADGNSFGSWHTAPAPYFFPDMLFYFIIHAFTTNFRLVTVIYSILQYLVMLFLLERISQMVYPRRLPYAAVAANLLIALFLADAIAGNGIVVSHLVLSVSAHLGTFLNTLLCLFLVLKWDASGNRWMLLWLFLAVVAGFVSDRLMAVMFLGPCLLACGWVGLAQRKKKYPALGGLVLAAGVCGFILFGYLRDHVLDIPPAPETHLTVRGSLDNFAVFLKTAFAGLPFIAAIHLLALLSLVLHVIALFRVRKKIATTGETVKFFYLVFSVSMALAVYTAPVFFRLYAGPDCTRYQMGALVWLLFHLPLVLPGAGFHAGMRPVAAGLAILLTGIGGWYCLKTQVVTGMKNTISYYPEYVRVMDGHRHLLERGAGSFWQAKQVNMFSKTGLRMVAVNFTLNPHVYQSNAKWYEGEPPFNFLLELSPEPSKCGETVDSILVDGLLLRRVQGFRFISDASGRKVMQPL